MLVPRSVPHSFSLALFKRGFRLEVKMTCLNAPPTYSSLSKSVVMQRRMSKNNDSCMCKRKQFEERLLDTEFYENFHLQTAALPRCLVQCKCRHQGEGCCATPAAIPTQQGQNTLSLTATNRRHIGMYIYMQIVRSG